VSAPRRLDGRRIVVTRAAEQAGPLAEMLAGLGAEPILMPLIRIVDAPDGGKALDAALQALTSYDWLLVTSPNGAARVRDAVTAAGIGCPLIAAVGVATEAALGRTADLIPPRQIASSLVEAFPAGGGRVLVAQAEQAGEQLAAGLVAKGWSVDVVVAYRTLAVVPSSAQLLSVLSADAVLFASGSAVRAWARSFGAGVPAITVAIGPSTAAVAVEMGLKVDVIATDHSLDGLVGALLTYLSDDD
jgi:uroporphyrinogen-III synthase